MYDTASYIIHLLQKTSKYDDSILFQCINIFICRKS